MRVVVIALLAAGLGFVIALTVRNDFSLTKSLQPTVPPPVPRVIADKQAHDCRDLCEQTAIVEHASEREMNACRARCPGQPPPPPNEPIRRITVAPADHQRTIRNEPAAR